MSLYVYDWVDEKEGKIPVKVVNYNDWYFNKYTLLENTSSVRSVLSRIEGAKYLDEARFISRDGVALSRECLSTGGKTVLNIVLHPEICFDALECGENAMYESLLQQQGHVIWHGAQFDECYDLPCDVIYKGNKYLSIDTFLTAFDRRS